MYRWRSLPPVISSTGGNPPATRSPAVQPRNAILTRGLAISYPFGLRVELVLGGKSLHDRYEVWGLLGRVRQSNSTCRVHRPRSHLSTAGRRRFRHGQNDRSASRHRPPCRGRQPPGRGTGTGQAPAIPSDGSCVSRARGPGRFGSTIRVCGLFDELEQVSAGSRRIRFAHAAALRCRIELRRTPFQRHRHGRIPPGRNRRRSSGRARTPSLPTAATRKPRLCSSKPMPCSAARFRREQVTVMGGFIGATRDGVHHDPGARRFRLHRRHCGSRAGRRRDPDLDRCGRNADMRSRASFRTRIACDRFPMRKPSRWRKRARRFFIPRPCFPPSGREFRS